MNTYKVFLLDGGSITVKAKKWTAHNDGDLTFEVEPRKTTHCFARGQWKYVKEVDR